MRIQTQGSSNKVWLSRITGVIDSTIILSYPTLEKILAAVNEKYRTSFEGWSQIPTAYEVGDNVPNWNEYGKIRLTPNSAVFVSEKLFLCIISNSTLIIITNNQNYSFVTTEDSRRYELSVNIWNSYYAEIIQKFADNGLSFNSVTPSVRDYVVGEIIPNWNSIAIYR